MTTSGHRTYDTTWNPVRGCAEVSRGCRNCWAAALARQAAGPGEPYEGFVQRRWTGRIETLPNVLTRPFNWRRDRDVLVSPMSDLFHPDVDDEFIRAAFAVMAATHHRYQVLTKRPDRAARWFKRLERDRDGLACHQRCREALAPYARPPFGSTAWPPRNVWLGTSCEDQVTAEQRIPALLQCRAALSFVAYEPALGPLDLTTILHDRFPALHGIGWVWIGPETGVGARPFDPRWGHDVIQQCRDVPVFCRHQEPRAWPTCRD